MATFELSGSDRLIPLNITCSDLFLEDNDVVSRGSIVGDEEYSDCDCNDLDSIGSSKDVCDIDWSLVSEEALPLHYGSAPDFLETDSLKLSMYKDLPRTNTRSECSADERDDWFDECDNHSYIIPLKEPAEETSPTQVLKRICLPRNLRNKEHFAPGHAAARAVTTSRVFLHPHTQKRRPHVF